MSLIEWDQSFDVGVKLINDQHKRLFLLFNKLYDAKEKNIEKTLNDTIQELMFYVDFHFRTEEKYFKEFQYEKTKEHMEQHKIFENKAKDFHKKYLEKKEEGKLTQEIINFLKDWLINHIKIVDKEYKKCFNDHGLV
ncbi:hemerythrin family protein [Candidatus Wolfebacteria bacterium]|nr:hemerythrin family protein [Candidatus Wolfebacteria bacterium]